MKRLYMALGFVAAVAFGTNTYAQTADLQAQVIMNQYECLNSGDSLQSDTNVTSMPYGIWGVINQGPDDLFSGDKVMGIDPRCKMSTNTQGNAQIGVLIWTLSASPNPAPSAVFGVSGLQIDSIHTLGNLDSIVPGKSLFAIFTDKSDLVDGETYAFFFYVIGTGSDPNAPDNTDPDMSNNFDYVPITWHCTPNTGGPTGGDTTGGGPGTGGTGIYDMILNAAQNVTIYPNPAQNTLNFKYGFIKNTNATARVIDQLGRTLITKDLGAHTIGTREFSMDITNLPAGNYTLQVTTDYMNGVGKFTVSK